MKTLGIIEKAFLTLLGLLGFFLIIQIIRKMALGQRKVYRCEGSRIRESLAKKEVLPDFSFFAERFL